MTTGRMEAFSDGIMGEVCRATVVRWVSTPILRPALFSSICVLPDSAAENVTSADW
jgi:hypothetical protein